jgi:hypothetical protein
MFSPEKREIDRLKFEMVVDPNAKAAKKEEFEVKNNTFIDKYKALKQASEEGEKLLRIELNRLEQREDQLETLKTGKTKAQRLQEKRASETALDPLCDVYDNYKAYKGSQHYKSLLRVITDKRLVQNWAHEHYAHKTRIKLATSHLDSIQEAQRKKTHLNTLTVKLPILGSDELATQLIVDVKNSIAPIITAAEEQICKTIENAWHQILKDEYSKLEELYPKIEEKLQEYEEKFVKIRIGSDATCPKTPFQMFVSDIKTLVNAKIDSLVEEHEAGVVEARKAKEANAKRDAAIARDIKLKAQEMVDEYDRKSKRQYFNLENTSGDISSHSGLKQTPTKADFLIPIEDTPGESNPEN